MTMSIAEMQAALVEFEKAAPAIQRALKVLPDLKKIVELASIFGAAASGTPGNIGGNTSSIRPIQPSLLDAPSEDEGFTKVIMSIMKSERRRIKPKEMKKILLSRGLLPEGAPENKVNFTMYYLGNRTKLLDGDGNVGYVVSEKGWKSGGDG